MGFDRVIPELPGTEFVLKFEGGFLRPLKPEDVHEDYVSGLNDPEVNRYLVGARQSIQTFKSVTGYVQLNLESKNEVLFGVWEENTKTHCGTVRLHGIEHIHHTAYIGVCLFDKRVWGRGLAAKAIRTATQWAFDKLKLRWIEAGTYEENLASQKTFLAAGYDWVYDVTDKYLFEGKPTKVKFFAARNIHTETVS